MDRSGTCPDRSAAYARTQVGGLTYGQAAQALGTTFEEIRAACKIARDRLTARMSVPRPRQPISGTPQAVAADNEVAHA